MDKIGHFSFGLTHFFGFTAWKVEQNTKVGQATAYDSNNKLFTTIDTPATVIEKISVIKKLGVGGVVF